MMCIYKYFIVKNLLIMNGIIIYHYIVIFIILNLKVLLKIMKLYFMKRKKSIIYKIFSIILKLSYDKKIYYSSNIPNDLIKKRCKKYNTSLNNSESLKCPICSYIVGNVIGLYYHNISVHPNYIFHCLYRENKIIVLKIILID